MQMLMLIGCTPYAAATTALAARRHGSVLKRLRTTPLSSAGILAGVLTPYALVGLVQAVVLTGVTRAAGGPRPERWWPMVLAVLLGTLLAAAFAVATAVVTPVPELAQLTTVPVFLGFFGGGLWRLGTDAMSWPMLLLPGASLTDLIRMSWQVPGSPCIAPGLAVAFVAGALGLRWFRWDARSASL
jgi:ABC-2 type transport system permease protein